MKYNYTRDIAEADFNLQTNDHCKGNTALVRALDIVRNPSTATMTYKQGKTSYGL